ncbi:MAG: class II fructose-bisphosphatase [Rhodobiaceae bacterium]|jgi:fructose-1,6-bisphosphatase II / sedoheptulose-1,7-bisphosphatase|nr:class II fructose-bisphosphatase [Rhodobiaceae bacterium]MBT7279828.1 class II fructose-bisphosphatase [Rhodobiaceae bacterium]
MASKKIDRSLTLELARVTERAAVAAAKLIGRGDEKAADQAAVDAMRRELNALNIDGEVVIGEGERDEAPMLYIGEKVGTGDGPKVDIALDPLEGTTLTAKGMGNALAVVAMAEGGSLLNAPDVYMDKIAIGGGYPANTVDLDADPADNVKAVAKAKGVDVGLVNVCILDRPRHAEMIGKVRAAGARVTLISDGDIAGVIHCTDPSTGIDMYMGTGGAPEGVLAAAALRCTGGQMQGRLVTTDEGQKERARKMGIEDFNRKYTAEEMASGDVVLSATGVTTGSMLTGIAQHGNEIWTDTLLMRSSTGTIRWIKARHTDPDKFHLND